MKSILKVNDFVLLPSGHSALVREVLGTNAKVTALGYFDFGHEIPKLTTFPVKKLTPITKDHAWKIAPKFPGIDC